MASKARSKFRDYLAKISVVIFIVIVIVAFLFPILYILLMSLKTPLEAVNFKHFVRFTPTLQNYAELFKENDFQKYFIHSVIICIFCVVISIVFGAPTAYALSRSKSKWVSSAMLIVLLLRVIPPVCILVPVYNLYSKINFNDTYYGVILVYLTFALPLCIWLLKGAFDGLSEDIEQAAYVDGCSVFQTFIRISLPIVSESLAAAAILIWVNSWNEYLYALILTRTNTKTLPVVINSFMRFDKTEYGLIAAAAIVISAPVILFSIIVNKYLVSGMTAGAVKE